MEGEPKDSAVADSEVGQCGRWRGNPKIVLTAEGTRDKGKKNGFHTDRKTLFKSYTSINKLEV